MRVFPDSALKGFGHAAHNEDRTTAGRLVGHDHLLRIINGLSDFLEILRHVLDRIANDKGNHALFVGDADDRLAIDLFRQLVDCGVTMVVEQDLAP